MSAEPKLQPPPDRDAVASASSGAARPVLCVDLDGTLVATDTFAEALAATAAARPLNLMRIAGWMLQGRAVAKARCAEVAALDASTLPYREELLEYLRSEKATGRRIVLATAGDRRVADAVAAHLGLFDEVLASDGTVNLKGPHKARALVERYGAKGFTYAGDAPADLTVWPHAAGAVVVGGRSLADQAARHAPVERHFEVAPAGFRVWRKALRLHQWLKNLLVFAPALAAHRLSEPGSLRSATLAFLAFGLCASSVYLTNDLTDLSSDRAHRTKRHRPLASGRLPIQRAVLAVPLLLAGAFGLASLVSPSFAAHLAAYLTVTVAYTFALKRQPLIDVLCLSGLYLQRILAGAAATSVAPSRWFAAFALFFFLGLALVKRVSELRVAGASTNKRRGYQSTDADLLSQMGVASAFATILVLALYLSSPEVARLYAHPLRLWGLIPLALYWQARVWLITHRGEMADDPVLFAATDRTSHVVVVLGALLVGMAI